MIYIFLSKNKTDNTYKIIEYLKQNITEKYKYSLFFENYIQESKYNFIDKENDIVLWEPIVAYNNLEFLKLFVNSIVILNKPSVYVQKISQFNPINENLAINNGFYITYINPDDIDITNSEWRLVVKQDTFLITIERLINFIETTKENLKDDIITLEEKTELNLNKFQINLNIKK